MQSKFSTHRLAHKLTLWWKRLKFLDSIAVSVFVLILVEFDKYYQKQPKYHWWWDEQPCLEICEAKNIVKICYKARKCLFHQSLKSSKSICHVWLIWLFIKLCHLKWLLPWKPPNLVHPKPSWLLFKVNVCLFPFPTNLIYWSYAN